MMKLSSLMGRSSKVKKKGNKRAAATAQAQFVPPPPVVAPPPPPAAPLVAEVPKNMVNDTIFHTMAISCGINEMRLPQRPYDSYRGVFTKTDMKEYTKQHVFKPLLHFIRDIRHIRVGMFGILLFSDSVNRETGKSNGSGDFWAEELAKYGKIIASDVIHNPSYQETGTKIRMWQWYPSDETKVLIESLGENNAPKESGWFPHTNLFYSELKLKEAKLEQNYGKVHW